MPAEICEKEREKLLLKVEAIQDGNCLVLLSGNE